jgi:hypothetical protein
MRREEAQSLSQQKACVIFNKLVVNNIENSSGIFIGTNQALGWSTYGRPIKALAVSAALSLQIPSMWYWGITNSLAGETRGKLITVQAKAWAAII